MYGKIGQLLQSKSQWFVLIKTDTYGPPSWAEWQTGFNFWVKANHSHLLFEDALLHVKGPIHMMYAILTAIGEGREVHNQWESCFSWVPHPSA